jgi:peroxiredoxin
VEVEVENIWLNYPNEHVEPGIKIGVLQYQIDHCPAVLTTETRLRFQRLKRGKHTITISLPAATTSSCSLRQ